MLPSCVASSAVPSASTSWRPADVAAAAFALRALGMPETVAAYTLRALAARGVRNVAAYVRPWTRDDADAWAGHVAELEADLSSGRAARRGDLIQLRSLANWPWRSSTSQPHYNTTREASGAR